MEVPSVFTMSGIAVDFIEDRMNALVVPFKDPDAIYEAMTIILNDKTLREKIVSQGKSDVQRLFDIREMTAKLDALYTAM
jgi:glycosyltransferase involved in cell wall biosynthesis